MNSPIVTSINAGEIYVGKEPSIVSTILGSCISVCLYSEKSAVGGMIHYALPDRTHAKNSQRNDLNFGDTAIAELVNRLLKIPGLKVEDLQAKIVGGGNVNEEMTKSHAIGQLNIEVARKSLAKLKIKIIGENVGGNESRKIFFYTDSGRLRVSKLEEKSKPVTVSNRKIRVLVIDDSKTIRDILSKVFTSEKIEVVGTAASAEEAEPLLTSLKPDVITLDVHMPGMDGVTFLSKYLPKHPIPTIMISSISMQESGEILKALELGAVDYIQKPSLQEVSTQAEYMREKIIVASTIRVQKKNQTIKRNTLATSFSPNHKFDKIVAIGSSTGGTEALKEVLLGLPSWIPPIVIVQHIPPIFSAAFAKRLNELCDFEVKEAADGDVLKAGRVLIAPGGLQMELQADGQGGYKVRVFDGEKVNRHKPSVDVLFDSVAKLVGKLAVGVILTGMGNDGAAGLLRMRKSGASTIGQDEASSVVYGMPRAAFELGAVMEVCPLSKIAEAMMKNLGKEKAA